MVKATLLSHDPAKICYYAICYLEKDDTSDKKDNTQQNKKNLKNAAFLVDLLYAYLMDFWNSAASLTTLFHDVVTSEEHIREKVLNFIKDKVGGILFLDLSILVLIILLLQVCAKYLICQVFPLKAELLKPQEQMERHVTDLVKKVGL